MAANAPDSLVLVCTASSPFEADVVRAMLAEEQISSSVENENSPFPGLAVTACRIYVATADEAQARTLIEEHDAKQRKRRGEADTVDWISKEEEEQDTAEYDVPEED